MAATVKVFGVQATITDMQWSSDFEDLTKMLQSMLDPDGPSGSDPNPDYTAAALVVEALGGEIVSFDEADFDPDAVY